MLRLFRHFFVFLSICLIFTQIIYSQNQSECATNPNKVGNVGQLLNTTWTLKILLVEFDDVKHNDDPVYTYEDFENLFFSSGIYVSPNKYSPDGVAVFGSMRDYYYKMSEGNFILNGYVVNPDANSDDVPDWLTLPNDKSVYDAGYIGNWGSFVNASLAAASNAGINVSTNSTTKLAIIYAGQYIQESGSKSSSKRFLLSKRPIL